jgi:hypothetical protein
MVLDIFSRNKILIKIDFINNFNYSGFTDYEVELNVYRNQVTFAKPGFWCTSQWMKMLYML